MNSVIPPHLNAFIRSTVQSIWELEALMVIYGTPQKCWTAEVLSDVLRASVPLAKSIFETFQQKGLVVRDSDGYFRYAPAPEMNERVAELARFKEQYPLAVAKEIIGAPNDKIRTFISAFRFRKD